MSKELTANYYSLQLLVVVVLVTAHPAGFIAVLSFFFFRRLTFKTSAVSQARTKVEILT